MRRLALFVAGLFAFAAPANAQHQAIWESWGKPNVGFDQYRGDAIECGRADVRVAEVKDMMQTVTEACLAGRGYVRFRLTPEQHAHLARIRIGKPERHQYLYRLASDPAIVSRQAIR